VFALEDAEGMYDAAAWLFAQDIGRTFNLPVYSEVNGIIAIICHFICIYTYIYIYILGLNDFKVQRFKPFLTQLMLEDSEQVEISQTSHFFSL